MKFLRVSLLIILSLIAVVNIFAQSAKIEKIWITHNIAENGKYGVRINAKFSVNGMHNKQGRCYAWFNYANGSPLQAGSGEESKYKTSKGQVSVSQVFTPKYDGSTYSDFSLFMPYDVLRKAVQSGGSGSYDLKFNIGLFDNNSFKLAESDFQTFTYNIKENNPTESNKAIILVGTYEERYSTKSNWSYFDDCKKCGLFYTDGDNKSYPISFDKFGSWPENRRFNIRVQVRKEGKYYTVIRWEYLKIG